MKRIVLTLSICLLAIATNAQSYKIKGQLVSAGSEVPIEYANVVLNTTDSTFVTGTTTDEKGNFSLTGIQQGNYRLVASCIGYQPTDIGIENLKKDINLGKLFLDSASVRLDEVTVSASRVINKMDRKVIFPNSMQVKTSPNGIDLLRNMHLNGVLVNQRDNSVSGVRGGTVQLRVNGAPADVKEIQGINPKDVIRVEYHDEPSLRYGDAEAVVDYIVRRKESGGAVMLSANNSPTTGWGEEYASAKMNYRKSEFGLDYSYTYHKYDKMYRTNREIFNFADGSSLTRLEDGLPTDYKEHYHYLRLNYSYQEPDKYLFSANIFYNYYGSPRNRASSFLYPEGNKDKGVHMMDYKNFNDKKPSFDLYYQHNLKKKQLLVFNVVGTYIRSFSHRTYQEVQGDETLTDILSDTYGNKYSIITEGIYEKEFKAGRLSMGVKHTQSFSDNDYTGSAVYNSDLKQSYTYFYAEWMGKVKNFMYSAGVGGTRTGMRQEGEKYNDIRFNPSLRLGYQFNNHTQIRYRGEVSVQAPSLGDLNDVEQPIDSLQIRRGNPSLKPVTTYMNRLTFSYNKGILQSNLEVVDQYKKDPLIESTTRENNKFIRQMRNGKYWHNIEAAASINLSLLDDHISIFSRGGLNWTQNSAEDYNHTLRNWFIYSSVSGNYKNFTLSGEVMSRRNYLMGETIRYRDQMAGASLEYQWKGLSAGVMMMWTIGKYQQGMDNLNKYASSRIRNYLPEVNNMLTIKLGWNFEFGRKYRSGQKRTNNNDSDSGVLKGNR